MYYIYYNVHMRIFYHQAIYNYNYFTAVKSGFNLFDRSAVTGPFDENGDIVFTLKCVDPTVIVSSIAPGTPFVSLHLPEFPADAIVATPAIFRFLIASEKTWMLPMMCY
jgi:hypothetical protein